MAVRAWKQVEQLMERYDRAERAWKQIEAALELFQPNGRLNDCAGATGVISAAVKEKELAGHTSDRYIWRYVQLSGEWKEAALEGLF